MKYLIHCSIEAVETKAIVLPARSEEILTLTTGELGLLRYYAQNKSVD